jgi:hypothetical protein
MCLLVSYKKNKKKYETIYFFKSLKSLKKGIGSVVGSGPEPDPINRGTNSRIRICTKIT